MIWIFIIISALLISLLVYIFYPSIKKILSKNKTIEGKIKKEKKIRYKEDTLNKKIEIIQNRGDLFNEESKTDEDLDTKIDFDNFDLGGLFEDESPKKSEDDFNKKFNDKDFDEFFNKYFMNEDSFQTLEKPALNNKTKNRLMSNEELSDLLWEGGKFNEEDNEIAKQFESLPNEIKVLILSNFLDRKDI